jgi:hypothetical protein
LCRIHASALTNNCNGPATSNIYKLAQSSRVRDQLEPQPDDALLTGLARIGVARRAVGRGLEMRIAEAAVAAAGERRALPDRGEIGQQGLAVLFVDLGSHRHLEHDVVRVGAVAVLAHAAAAALGLEMLLVAVVDQGVEALDRHRDHVAALAAVAAAGPAEFNELFAAERHAAVSAVAGADENLGFIEEFHGVPFGVLRSLSGPGINSCLARSRP